MHGRQGCWGRSTGPGSSAWPTCTRRARSGRIGREADEPVLLALALAVRALRNGSVALDLQTVGPDGVRRGGGGRRRLRRCRGRSGRRGRRRVRRARWSPSDATVRPAVRCGWPAGCCTSSGTGSRRSRSGVGLQDRLAADPPAVDAARLAAGLDRLFPDGGDGRARPQRLAAAVSALQLAERPGRRAGYRQDHHGGPAAGAAARPARTPRCGSRWPRRPARRRPGWRRQSGGRRPSCRRPTGIGSATCVRRPCTGCSAGCRRPGAGSATTPTTSCRTTSWSSTRRRWCR